MNGKESYTPASQLIEERKTADHLRDSVLRAVFSGNKWTRHEGGSDKLDDPGSRVKRSEKSLRSSNKTQFRKHQVNSSSRVGLSLK